MDLLSIYWRRPRKAQHPPELNSYPSTPGAYYEGYYPASGLARSLRSEYKVKLQSLPELNVYPVLPPEISAINPLLIQTSRRTRFQTPQQPLVLLERPTTSVAYYDGYYPGSKRAESFRVSFKTELQKTPELNSYPETTGVFDYPGWAISFAKTRKTKRKHLSPIELNQYTETPQGYYSGFYPGSKLAESFKSVFKVVQQRIPEHGEYPATVADAPISAWMPHFEPIKNYTNKQLQKIELNEYPQTNAAYYTGYFPASKLAKANYRKPRKVDVPQPALSFFGRIVALRSFGVNGVIDSCGQGVVANISATGQGVTGTITISYGVNAIIDETGQGAQGEIDETGQGVAGDI